jgi:acetyl esterase
VRRATEASYAAAMALDPHMKTLLDQIEAIGAPPMHTLTPEQARAAMDGMLMMMGPGEEIASVEDRALDVGGRTLTVRIYRPAGLGDGPAPTLVFYHGGGFVIGNLESHDRDCRALANRGACQVIAVDYRLAPEHPFLAVGGDSAGGNLAAVAALHARDVGIPLRMQLLIYPAVAGAEHEFASRTENGKGYMLETEMVEWFMKAYFPDGIPLDWRAAPMLATDHSGLAPALVITAEYDPLRDEGEAYATMLEGAGVPAKATRYDGLVHGFFGMGALVPAALPAVDEAGAALRDALHD